MKRLIPFLLVLLGIAPLSSTPRQGQIKAGTNVGAQEVRLALPTFESKSADPNAVRLTALFNQVLRDDLDYSGNIALISPSFYPLGKFQVPTDIKVEDWTKPSVNAQYLVFGSADLSGGTLRFEARLWDLGVVENRELLGYRFTSGALTDDAVRLTAHTFADQIVDKLFGGRIGIARTRIAYVSVSSNNIKETIKEINVMDYDGANSAPLTTYRSISIMPAWSPDSDKVAFISFRSKTPQLEIMSVLDRRPLSFPSMAGTANSPAWSPDGSRIAFASSKSGNFELYASDWNGKNMQQITVSPKSIEVSPSWNPKTGQSIVFVSDRSGTQQLYIMNADGTNPERIIDEGGDAEYPSWSPDGQNIVFSWLRNKTDGHYNVYIHDLVSGRNTQLTGATQDQGQNERPSWSPDGRHIVFASNRTGVSQIYTMLANGQKVRQLTRNGRNEGPAWSAFGK